ncbi:MAG TPA: pyridoxal phosphate-dependent aminotransferase [Streptosporangiaceae bacterium]|nr:pyridoxal phosphate-dependent aminotransferase [Streptosporangiaceae bacterium]
MRQFPASPITALIDEYPDVNLSESIGPDLSVADILGQDGLAALAGVGLGYGTSAGHADLRALVAGRLGVPGEQVLLTSGAAGALFLVALLHSDNEIVACLPCYPPMLDVLRGLGARVVTVSGRFEDGYRIDLDAFSDRLSARTRLVMVASPQNPSGVPVTPAEADEMLAAMARRCPEALLLVDETFREATYGGAAPATSFAGRSERVLTCASLSKAYGAPGLRIGWLTVPGAQLREQLRLAKFNSSICCGSLDEFLATRLLSRADEVLASRGELLARARATVEHWIGEQDGRLQWLRPEAGAFCCVRLDPGRFGAGDVRRVHGLLAGQRTAVAPGPWFGDSEHVMRLGLAYPPPGELEKGLGIIAGALRP